MSDTGILSDTVTVRRRAQYVSMPWRNGAGVTLEIAREPAPALQWDWRLSLATVARSGPFSDFTGYHRSVSLISGQGFYLDIGAQDRALLTVPGATCIFPGDASTTCTLVQGECCDLSLTVRRPGRILAARCLEVDENSIADLPLGALAQNAIFCLDGVAVVLGSSPYDDEQIQQSVGFQDTLLLGPSSRRWTARAAAGGSATLLLLAWRPA